MLTILFDGIAYGMLLFVLACGLSVTLGLMNFINLAHGSFAMAGGYSACPGQPAGRSVRAWPAARVPVTAVIGGFLERTLYMHVYAEPSRPGAVLDRPGLHVGGRVDYVMGSSQQFVQIPEALQGQFIVFGVGMGKYRLLIIAICGLITVGLQLALSQDALRQPAARRGRRSARRARARHQCRRGVRA